MFNTQWIKEFIKNGGTHSGTHAGILSNRGFIADEELKYAVSSPKALEEEKESCRRDYKEERTDASITAVKELIGQIHSHL